jgi:hypothetical protein
MKQKTLIGLAIFVGLALALFGMLLDLFKLVLFWLGVIAMPKDIADSVTEGRIVLNWLITMPWWVAVLLNIASLAISVALIWWGVRALVAQQKLQVDMPEGYMTAEQAAELIEWHKKFQADFGAYRQEFVLRESVVEANADAARNTHSFDVTMIKGQVESLSEKFDAMQRELPNTISQLINIQVSPILDRSIDFNEEAKASLARIEAIAAVDPTQSPQDTAEGTQL